MAKPLPKDFGAFLRLLDEHEIEYLIVGGYAVGYYGYPRATGDIDIWVRPSRNNAERLVRALGEFGFDVPELQSDLFLEPDRIIRMGTPPNRIELLTSVSGVSFQEAYASKETDEWGGVPVQLISLAHLKENKRASGRPRDLDDLEQLP